MVETATTSVPVTSRDVSVMTPVAVVIPVRNEALHLEAAVRSVLNQDYEGQMTVCLAVGPSDDGTEAVAARLARDRPEVRLVGNPSGATPAGLNAAIRATDEPVIVRADGHCELASDYVRTAVRTLVDTGAVNVGGVQRAAGVTLFEQAVAVAVTSRLGTGGSRFRVGGEPGPTDTVYLGVFRREAVEAVGLFDETLVRNQDYELNIRLREAGGIVWFDPALVVDYRPRGSLRSLARQYFQYGQWKREVLRRHPGSVRLRQVIPPFACIGVFVSLIAAVRFRPALAVPVLYAATVGVSAARPPQLSLRQRLSLLVIYPAIHFAWAVGLLRGPARPR